MFPEFLNTSTLGSMVASIGGSSFYYASFWFRFS